MCVAVNLSYYPYAESAEGSTPSMKASSAFSSTIAGSAATRTEIHLDHSVPGFLRCTVRLNPTGRPCRRTSKHGSSLAARRCRRGS
jgi:hypothetical protein